MNLGAGDTVQPAAVAMKNVPGDAQFSAPECIEGLPCLALLSGVSGAQCLRPQLS